MGQAFQDYKDAWSWTKDNSAIWSWIGQHQAFSQAYSRCHNHLLGGDGPLPADHRHFIAIMACTESRCGGLLAEERGHYLRCGGSASWLDNLQYAPLKLRRLATLNTILASRPWAFHQQHIKSLLTGAGSWSLAELLQAIVILVHFHSLCSYAVANNEVPTTSTAVVCDTTTASCDTTAVVECDTHELAQDKQPQSSQNQRKIQQEERSSELKSSKTAGSQRSIKFCLRSTRSHKKEKVVVMKEAKKKVTASTVSGAGNNTNTGTAVSTVTAVVKENKAAENKDKMVERLEQVYEQYELVPLEVHQPDHDQHLNITDFSWDDHGFSVMSRFYGDMSLLLDDKFRVAKQMTYNRYGDHNDVDTSRFRRTVWNYVQMLFGVIHEDFDYSDIEQVLSPTINQFIQVSAKTPHRIQQINNLLLDFNRSEKAHLNILVVEAKLQALLLYSLRAVMNHMAKS